MFHLMERDNAARPHAVAQSPQERGRIGQKEQDETADDSVKRPRRVEALQLGLLEAHVCGADGAASSRFNRRGCAIKPEDRTAGSDHTGRQQRDVADPTTEIEHLHAGPQACATQYVLC
jgi:hypothetical protein